MAEEKMKENPVQEAAEEETAGAPVQEAAGEAGPGGAPETGGRPEDAGAPDAPDAKGKGPFGKGRKEPRKDQGQLLAEAADKYLRLAAEYDNYRKRTAKEKESAWSEAKAQTVAAFLPVYDNLERALKQETADEAYKKGVEMTMKGLQDALTGLGVEMIPALGETFDPNRHNAVMHCDDPESAESTIVEVFQQGFLCGDKVIRFSMVKVAN